MFRAFGFLIQKMGGGGNPEGRDTRYSMCALDNSVSIHLSAYLYGIIALDKELDGQRP